MSRTLLLFAAAFFAFGCPRAPDRGDPGGERPNIVFIMADDLGFSDLGCQGAFDVRTPAIDSLAADGVRLTRCYASAPSCTPTRAAFLTGRYPARSGLEGPIGPAQREVGLPAAESILARSLEAAGYATGLVGKWHLGYAPHFGPRVHGFQEFFGFLGGQIDYHAHRGIDGLPDLWEDGRPARVEGYATDLVADRAVRFLRGHRGGPFFLWVAFNAPHAPYQNPDDPSDLRAPKEWLKGERSDYVAMVERMDRGVGRILEEIDALGLRENTIVVFTNDNGGEVLGRNAPLKGGKGDLYEGGIRVPALVRWPGRVPPGARCDQVAVTQDFTATFLALAGVSPRDGRALDGIDLTAYLEGEREPVERTLVWRVPREDRDQRAVLRGRVKYIRIQGALAGGSVREFLFDVEADASERRDLSRDRPDDLEDMRRILEGWEREMAGEKPRFRTR